MNTNSSAEPLRLLSLDGGGVRGLSSLLILQRLMQLVNPDSPPKPCDVFHLIGGTSTGGLIAIMLGRLKMDTKDCIDEYLKLSELVFQPQRQPYDLLGRARDCVQLQGRFDGNVLTQLMKEVIQGARENADAGLREPHDPPCKVFVCAVRREVAQPVLLRSYGSPGATQTDCTIWEAARATSAATSFFDPVTIGPYNQQFIDGATGCNNPVRQVLSEARKIWPDADRRIKCIISLGTGMPKMSAFGNNMRDVARTLIRIATETELTAEEFLLDHTYLGLSDSYFRFNVTRGLEDVGLEEYTATPTIASATMVYLDGYEISQRVERCVHRVRERATCPDDERSRVLSREEEFYLQSLYTVDYSSYKGTIAKPVSGTCEWFLQHHQYKKWRDQSCSSLLWVSGDPGCGKSVLSSFLIDELNRHKPEGIKASSVLFFFCDDTIQEQRDASAIMRGILHQLLTVHPSLIKHATYHFKMKGQRAANELLTLWEMFTAACTNGQSGNVITVIDALDECEETSRTRLLTLITKYFVQNPKKPEGCYIKMIVTSRPELSIADNLEVLHEVRLRAEDETENISKDIAMVVQQRIGNILHKFNSPNRVIQSLSQHLINLAGHTFLWVALVLQMIERSAEASEEALRQIVLDLPDGLDDIYERILNRVGERDRENARKVLHIIVAAFRPVTLNELNIAMSLRDGHTIADDIQSRLEPNMERTVQKLCGPFLKIVDSKIYLIHQTAKQFLIRVGGHSMVNGTIWKHSLDPVGSHLAVARSCVWYLISRTFQPRILPPNVSYLETDSYVNLFDFLDYAASYWAAHIREAEDMLDLALMNQVTDLCNARTGHFHAFSTVYRRKSPQRHLPQTSLAIGSFFGLKRTVEVLFGQGLDVHELDSQDWTALDFAALGGHTEVATFLLQRGANPDRGKGAVKCALMSYSVRMLRLLLEWGATTSAGWKEELLYAVDMGDEKCIRLLLDMGANPNIRLSDNGDTALIIAAKRGYQKVVQILLDGGAILGIRDDNRWTALEWAVEKGQFDVIELLMSKGYLRFGPKQCGPALALVASRGHKALLQLLINSGANLAAPDDLGRTALHTAAECGHETVAKLLLENQVDVNHTDLFGETALTRSAKFGHIGLVQLLLGKGADANLADKIGWTPLGWAAVEGHEPVVRLLLGHSKLTEDQDSERSPLSWARRNGHARIVQILESELAARSARGESVAPPISADTRHSRIIIPVQINGRAMNAEVLTSASASLIAVACVRNCGLYHLLDTRYEGIARGLSIAKILGKIHFVTMNIAGRDYPIALTVLSEAGFEISLGMDFLSKYRCVIDFCNDRLVLHDGKETVLPLLLESPSSRRWSTLSDHPSLPISSQSHHSRVGPE